MITDGDLPRHDLRYPPLVSAVVSAGLPISAHSWTVTQWNEVRKIISEHLSPERPNLYAMSNEIFDREIGLSLQGTLLAEAGINGPVCTHRAIIMRSERADVLPNAQQLPQYWGIC